MVVAASSISIQQSHSLGTFLDLQPWVRFLGFGERVRGFELQV